MSAIDTIHSYRVNQLKGLCHTANDMTHYWVEEFESRQVSSGKVCGAYYARYELINEIDTSR